MRACCIASDAASCRDGPSGLPALSAAVQEVNGAPGCAMTAVRTWPRICFSTLQASLLF